MDSEDTTNGPDVTNVTADSMCVLAGRLSKLRDEKSDLNERVKALGEQIKVIELRLVEVMLTNEMQNFNRAGTVFYLTQNAYASPATGQKEALFEALKKRDHGSLIVEKLDKRTLSSFVKEQRDEAGNMPDWLNDLVSVYVETSVNVQKAQKKKGK
ncbi:hypothetical protein AGMMS49992_11720 [Clostridia bacterium]|nr:hypothetical protein AGMMS49992_11720 [Clostridia bacterium]